MPCWPRLPNPQLFATSFYIRSGQVEPQWFSGTKPGRWMGNHFVVDRQSRWSFIFSMWTSDAALRRRLAWAILAKTGSHSNCAWRSVPVIKRIARPLGLYVMTWTILDSNTPRLSSRGLTQKNGEWQRLPPIKNLPIWAGDCFCSSALQQSWSSGVCRIVSDPVYTG